MTSTRFAPKLNNRMTLSLALKIEKGLADRYARYVADCEAYAAEGFRPRHCEHGTSQWTDYDNICGACEDGITMRERSVRLRFALAEAKERHERATALMAAAELIRNEGIECETGPVWKRISAIMKF